MFGEVYIVKDLDNPNEKKFIVKEVVLVKNWITVSCAILCYMARGRGIARTGEWCHSELSG